MTSLTALLITAVLIATSLFLARPASSDADRGWPWNMRVATFYCPPRLEVTDAELEDRVGLLQSLGYDTLLLGMEHFQLDYIAKWPELEALATRIAACAHRHGMKVIEHHSAGVFHTDHLDDTWQGHKLRELSPVNAKTGEADTFLETMVFVCPNNPLHWQIYADHARRYMTQAHVDGYMADDVELLTDTYTCACQFCRARFKEQYGVELPPASDATFWGNYANPDYRKWLRFRQQSVGGFHRRMRELRDAVAPQVRLLTCQTQPAGTGLPVLWGLAHDEIEPDLDVLFLEAGNAFGYAADWQFHAADMLLLRAMGHGRKPVFPLYYPAGAGNPNVVLFSSEEALARFRPEGLFPNGVGRKTGAYERVASPDAADRPGADELFFIWGLSRLYGDGWWVGDNFDIAAQAFPFERAHPNLWARGESMAQIALHYSRQTRDFYGGLGDAYHVDEWRGWAMTLLERNRLFDVVVDEDLNAPLPERIRLLILPNSACLSDRQAATVRAFAARGGRIIATGDTSLYTETGAPRKDFALAGLFGVHHVRTLRAEAGPARLGADTTLVRLNSGARLLGEMQVEAEKWPTGAAGHGGRVLYLAEKVGLLGSPRRPARLGDALVRAQGPRDPARQQLMRDCLVRMVGGPPVRLVNGPRGVIVSASASVSTVVAQLLNAGGSRRVAGETFDPNLCPFPRVRTVANRSVQLRVHSDIPAREALLYSPDLPDAVRLPLSRRGDEWCAILPPEALRRYAVVELKE
jgi:hypothetical protein